VRRGIFKFAQTNNNWCEAVINLKNIHISTLGLGGIPVLLVINGIFVILVLIPCVFCIIVIPLPIFLKKKNAVTFFEKMSDDLVPLVGVVAKKGTTSYVWNFFGVKNDDENTAVCRLCQKPVLAWGGNTSNLSSHLRNHHTKEYAAVTKAKESKKKKPGESSNKQVTLPVAIERMQPYPSSSKRAQEITNALSHSIVKEMMPFNIVERPGFRKLLNKLNDRYNIPSRKYFNLVKSSKKVSICMCYQLCLRKSF